MKYSTYTAAVAVLGSLVFALIIAVVAILTFDPSARDIYNYTVDDNQLAIENSTDYQMQPGLYGRELENTSNLFYEGQ